MKVLVLCLVASVALCVSAPEASADLIKITGTSAASGELGYFIVDDSTLTGGGTYNTLYASDFADFYFADPLGTAVISTSNVPSDTGVTYLAEVSGEFTVVGGGGDSLTASNGDRVYLAGTTSAVVGDFGTHTFVDVSWTTTAVVPEPGTLALLGLGLFGVAFARRRRSAKAS